MVVGNGMIAKAFYEYNSVDDILIFASGVSSSNLNLESEFTREYSMVKNFLQEYPKKLFIYFSSCSIEFPDLKDTKYNIHKLSIEKLIQATSGNYIIFRLPNVIGKGGNPNTIINYLFDSIKEYKEFFLWKYATRNIVDIEDVVKIIQYVIENNLYRNDTVNIAYEKSILVEDLIQTIETLLNKKSLKSIINKGSDFKIDIAKVSWIMKETNMQQPSIESLILKYKIHELRVNND
ncbi:hypothetical protein M947_08545 [Sulfurimonas hongkongensis]|uniref:NAD-dependent epimerase/dehydratase domain-containing protein n=1 Tax=Sulfurimonas hongkongensis TaxID=1172190 RepID=T0JQU5_9BACT|nr:NAD-dependent epimerase/dehydratase family protein [Sulfurimonas hongkongensis]EQB39192.1 hypothetical protein M947_08545 [Sulfurimonas hongkongensis]